MMVALVLATMALRCTTTMPLLVRPAVAQEADRLGRDAVRAYVRHDRAGLIELGMEPGYVDQDLKKLGDRHGQAEPTFCLDHMMFYLYQRVYRVKLDNGSHVFVNVQFRGTEPVTLYDLEIVERPYFARN
jgi:hypothetical protein